MENKTYTEPIDLELGEDFVPQYNILYVDDEDSNLRIFRRAFKKKYGIFLATSAEEGRQILAENDIHLIITDQKMPKITGVQFLESLLPQYEDLIFIILTGYADMQDIIQAINKCGIYRYIVKPWNKEEMDLTLENALEAYQLRQDNKKLIQELKEANLTLEGRVRERTAELELANAELKVAKEKAEAASKAKELFLSTMSHEIRTPLNAIIGIANLLKPYKHTNHEISENIEILDFAANNLLALINDVLDISKIEAGKILFESIDFNLKTIVNGVANTFKQRTLEKKIGFGVDLPESIYIDLIGDPVRLAQILTNLIGNAIKFTDKGNVTIRIRTQEELGENVKVAFSIIDTGIGIAPNKLDVIFEQFSQGSLDTTRKYGGTGLGLAITKRLVELQGGTIGVESELGQGSTFKVVMPFKKGERKNIEERAVQTEIFDLKNANILVAEDNKINQVLVRKFLTQWNASVEFADNGKIVLDKIQSKIFNLILMDLQMPEMDGYESAREVRKMEDEYFKTIPIIALTASTLTGEKEKVLYAGMNDYVLKPFNPKDLYLKIKYFLETPLANQQSGTITEIPNDEISLDYFKTLGKDDIVFYKEILNVALLDFQSFKIEFNIVMQNGDLEHLRQMCHKILPTIRLLKVFSLEESLNFIKTSFHQTTPQELSKASNHVNSVIDKLLDVFQSELKGISYQ